MMYVYLQGRIICEACAQKFRSYKGYINGVYEGGCDGMMHMGSCVAHTCALHVNGSPAIPIRGHIRLEAGRGVVEQTKLLCSGDGVEQH